MAEAARLRDLSLALLLATVAASCAPHSPALPVPPAVPPLTGEEIDVVARLLSLEDSRAYEEAVVAGAVRSGSPIVRRHAALALGRIGAPEGVEPLRVLLYDADSSVVASAAFSLGQLADTTSVERLARLLEPDAVLLAPTAAAEAAGALGKIGTPDAREVLLAYLSGADIAGVGLAVNVVAEALLAGWRAGIGPVEGMTRWTGAANPELRWRAIYALSRPPTPEAVGYALDMLEDAEPRVRFFAVRGLPAMAVETSGADLPTVVGRLVEAAGDSDYAVRIEALRVLGTYRHDLAVQTLADRVAAEEPHERLMAVESLGRVGPAAAAAQGALLALAFDAEQPPALRGAAGEALAAVAGSGAVSPLRALAADPEWRVRASAARALGSLGHEALAELHVLARDGDPRVASAGIRAATAAAGEPPVLVRSLLIEALQAADVIVRTAALEGLRELADAATLPLILDAYARAQVDPQNNAALAAIDALAALAPAGSAAQRAFFTRFGRSGDPLVRRRVADRFGDATPAAWGPPFPLDAGRDHDDYRLLVERWIAPSPQERILPRASILTGHGELEVELFAADAPLTVANFLRLASAGFFDEREWPRVVPGFVVQGGDPRGDTSGNPGYTIRDEHNRHRYLTGTVGMAHSGPDTAGSQFFVTHLPQPHLDGAYTVFGRLVAGEEVIRRLLPGDVLHEIREITDVIEE